MSEPWQLSAEVDVTVPFHAADAMDGSGGRPAS